MKEKTIQRKIQEWSKLFNIEPPRVVIKLHVKRKMKCLIPIPGRHDYISGVERIFGCFNQDNNKITIYRDGDKISIVKQQFIRYLARLKTKRDYNIINWNEIGKMKYDEFLDQEDLMIRRLTCAGMKTIYRWFYSK